MSAALTYALWVLAGAAFPVLVTPAGILRRVAVLILLGAFGFVVGYGAQVPMSFDFYGPFVALSLGALFGAILCIPSSDEGASGGRVAIMFAPAIALCLLSAIVLPFLGSGWMHAKELRDLMGEVAQGELAKDIEVLDQTQIRLVDQDSAKKRADELLGADQSLGSRVDVGKFTMQAVDGKLWWVAPLEHNGYFAWSKNGATPGYVKVSAANYRDAQLVLKVNGADLRLRYGEQGWFGDELERHIRNEGYTATGIAEMKFEIDDTGKPFWVVPTYHNTVVMGAAAIDGVLLVDPQSGDIAFHELGKVPAWVDRIQPEALVLEQITWWGQYVHGAFNMAGTDTMKPSKAMSVVYGKDGQAKWYVDLQTTGSDEGTIGFMLVDTQTKKATFYPQTGASEDAAVKSIEGKVQEKGYTATSPILYEVDGIPTYLSTLKDRSGNIKGIGLMSVADRSTPVFGESTAQALKAYEAALGRQTMSLSAVANAKEIEGVVDRFGQETVGGATTYYLGISGHPGTAYSGQDNSPALILTKVGDRVRLKVIDNGTAIVPMASFENLDFVKPAAPAQPEIPLHGLGGGRTKLLSQPDQPLLK